MAKPSDKTARRKANPVLAGLAAWFIPGAGHLYLRRPVRTAVLFLVINLMFWSGIAVGGIFTVNPRQEVWWYRAQMVTGLSGIVSYERQERMYKQCFNKLSQEHASHSREGNFARNITSLVDEQLAKDNLVVPPSETIPYVLSGVAGMLNLMCIFDAIVLAMMGTRGESEAKDSAEKGSAQAAKE